MNLYEFDELYRSKFGNIAGIDEAGRGPLAGPVVASVVVIEKPIEGITDSKVLSPAERERLYQLIMQKAHVGIGIATPEEIDVLNILNATRLAIKRAVESLKIPVDYYLIDGKNLQFTENSTCIVKGDMKSLSIASASIIAKVTRDRIMKAYDKIYPLYGFSHNYGYPTEYHKEVIKKYGATVFHRLTFSGVLECVDYHLLKEWLKRKEISYKRYEAVLKKKEKLKRQERLF